MRAIDRLVDPAAPAEEEGKRPLLKRPEEFRDLRIDRARPAGNQSDYQDDYADTYDSIVSCLGTAYRDDDTTSQRRKDQMIER